MQFGDLLDITNVTQGEDQILVFYNRDAKLPFSFVIECEGDGWLHWRADYSGYYYDIDNTDILVYNNGAFIPCDYVYDMGDHKANVWPYLYHFVSAFRARGLSRLVIDGVQYIPELPTTQMTFTAENGDMTFRIVAFGTYNIKSIKNGEIISETYGGSGQQYQVVSIQADANSTVTLSGKQITNVVFDGGVSEIDVSRMQKLLNLTIKNCTNVTSIDASHNTELKRLVCTGCTGLASLDIPGNELLTYFECTGCLALTSISYPATNSSVSSVVASAIANATAADGTVYTDSEGAYYSTIADAATAKGWTIEDLA